MAEVWLSDLVSRLTASSRSVPQVDVMTKVCFCQVGTAMVQVAMTSTCSVATWVAPRVWRTKADTSFASIQVAPGRPSISVGKRSSGMTPRRADTFDAKRASLSAASSARRSFTRTLPER
jgi:hypothetical protein